MRNLISVFFSIYTKSCNQITFSLADGTTVVINNKHICNEVLKAVKDNLASKLAKMTEVKNEIKKK